MPEKEVVKEVRQYLEDLKKRLETISSTSNVKVNYSIKSEYEIHIGSTKLRADVVLLKTTFNPITVVKNPVIIVECKASGNKGNGPAQLKAYLCARDTRFGIFAEGLKQEGHWKYYKNHGRYEFETLSSRKTFEDQVTDEANNEADVEEKIEKRINQGIEKQKKKLEVKYKEKEKELTSKIQGIEQKLKVEHESNEADLQADFAKKKSDLREKQQKLLNEKRKEGFKKGFWVGVISVIVLVIIIAIVASGG